MPTTKEVAAFPGVDARSNTIVHNVCRNRKKYNKRLKGLDFGSAPEAPCPVPVFGSISPAAGEPAAPRPIEKGISL